MAKKKKKTRVVYRKAKPKRRRSKKGIAAGNMGKILGAGLYGGVRARISTALDPIVSKIPAGNISDEVGMILASVAAKKFIGRKVPMVKEMADAALYVESAKIGETISLGQLNLGFLGGSAPTTTTGNNSFR